MTAFLDDVARNLARPMPRRRALRLFGGALVALAMPASRAGAAPATHDCPAQGLVLCQCPAANGLFFKLCCWSKEACTCDIPRQATCCQYGKIWKGGTCVCKEPCGGDNCCANDEFCANVRTQLCCKKGEKACGNRYCCQKNEECVSARAPGVISQSICVKRCPPSQAWCGKDKCCPPKWKCRNPSTGLCKRCEPNEEECDKKCCDKATSRCCGKAGCCPKNRSCCVTGDKQICCPAGQKCAVPILAGDIGIKPGTKAICCPQARLNNTPKLCCPPGQVALNNPGFRTPPPGISPYCCPAGQTCRVGGALICPDTQRDPGNCGSCGNVCASGICSGGICALP